MICLCIYQLMNIWVVFSLRLINKGPIKICTQVFVWTVLIFLGQCRGVGFLGPMITMYLTQQGISKLFSSVAGPFFLLTTCIWEFNLLHLLVTTWYCQVLNFNHSSVCSGTQHVLISFLQEWITISIFSDVNISSRSLLQGCVCLNTSMFSLG